MPHKITTINATILISGSGTNMENLIKVLHKKKLSCALRENGMNLVKKKYPSTQFLNYQGSVINREILTDNAILINQEISINFLEVISNNPSASGILRAKNLNIPSVVIASQNKSRQDFDKELANYLLVLHKKHRLDYILLAGFMRILTKNFFESLPQSIKILNIHPSFLPLHKGANGITQSFYDDNDFGGVSVHYVNEELDSGEIILQEKVYKIPNESLESFSTRVHELEYKLYPQALLKSICQG